MITAGRHGRATPKDHGTYACSCNVIIGGATGSAALTDPTLIKFIYKKPSGSAPTVLAYGIDAEIVKEATGKYYVDLLLNEAGLWKWRYESSGVVDSAQQDSFQVAAEDPIG